MKKTEMRETRYYKVADHVFSVTATATDFSLMGNYETFSWDMRECVFGLTIEDGEAIAYHEEMRQEEEGQQIICGRTDDGYSVFEYRWEEQTAGWLVSSADNHNASLFVASERQRKMVIDNALMVLFSLSTAEQTMVLFHAAVVSLQGKGYMFLGPSGTGKSTHAQLWLKYIDGTELVNDDNPVVRINSDGLAVVHGSPWSGKTPCYRNVSVPLAGVVQLSQAPYNRLRRLKGIDAYAVLVPSISGKRWDSHIADGLHLTENTLASTVPIWHLECLPDEAAVRVCAMGIIKDDN